jgi:hypothetical protein
MEKLTNEQMYHISNMSGLICEVEQHSKELGYTTNQLLQFIVQILGSPEEIKEKILSYKPQNNFVESEN